MDAQRGRIVFLGSKAHWPLKAGFSKGFPTHVPENIGLLVHPEPDKKEEEMGRGFQRYGISKLVPVMVMYELNRRLKKVFDGRFQICDLADSEPEEGHGIYPCNNYRPAGYHRLEDVLPQSCTDVCEDLDDHWQLVAATFETSSAFNYVGRAGSKARGRRRCSRRIRGTRRLL